MESPRPAGGPVLDSPLLGSGSLAHSSSHLSPLSESLPLSRRTITHHRTWEFILLLYTSCTFTDTKKYFPIKMKCYNFILCKY